MDSEQTIEQLVRQIQAGNETAFNDLYTKTSEHAYYLALQLVKNEDAAQDVLQDAYIRALNSIGTLQDPSKFQGWLNSIVVNTGKNYLKKKTPVLFSQMASEEDNDQEVDFEDESEQFSPEANVDYNETKRLVKEMIDRLPEKQRIAVILHYMEDYPVAQIAQIMECSEGTIKSRLSTARGQIKQDVLALERQGVKLYCAPLVPFLFWMFHSPAPAATISAASAATLAAGVATGAEVGAGAAAGAVTATGTTAGATTAAATTMGASVGTGTSMGAVTATGSMVGATVNTGATTAAGGAAAAGTAVTAGASTATAAAAATGLSLAAKLGITAAVAAVCIGGAAVGVTAGARSAGSSYSSVAAVEQAYEGADPGEDAAASVEGSDVSTAIDGEDVLVFKEFFDRFDDYYEPILYCNGSRAIETDDYIEIPDCGMNILTFYYKDYVETLQIGDTIDIDGEDHVVEDIWTSDDGYRIYELNYGDNGWFGLKETPNGYVAYTDNDFELRAQVYSGPVRFRKDAVILFGIDEYQTTTEDYLLKPWNGIGGGMGGREQGYIDGEVYLYGSVEIDDLGYITWYKEIWRP